MKCPVTKVSLTLLLASVIISGFADGHPGNWALFIATLTCLGFGIAGIIGIVLGVWE
jgi:hypothetical protein